MEDPLVAGRDRQVPPLIRFEAFSLDLRNLELRKEGHVLKLHPQPAQILALLVSRAGDVVSREEIQKNIWGSETYVDFDQGINSCVRQIRAALGDDPERPRFLQTLPRRGYRFIAPVQVIEWRGNAQEPVPREEGERVGKPAAAKTLLPRLLRWTPTLAAALALVTLVLLWRFPDGWGQRATRLPGTINSLAVLPLKNLADDPAQEYFADGMTDALIAQLAKIGALKVISRTSVMRYHASNKPLEQIGRELKVDGVLEGSVLRAGARVRVTVELVHAATDTHLWAETYERDLRDVLALQSDVAQAVAREIRVRVTPNEQARLTEARAVNPQAYDAYLKGIFVWNRVTKEGTANSIAFFRRAIELDPDYAPAYARLAFSYTLLASADFVQDKDSYPRAKEAALVALSKDPSLAEALAALGFVKHHFDWDWAGAETDFRRAISLEPNNVSAHHVYSLFLSGMERHDEALDEIERVLELEPLSLLGSQNEGRALLMARRYEAATEVLHATLQMDPDFVLTRERLGWAHLLRGMTDEAIREFQKARELSAPHAGGAAGFGGGATGLAYAYARSGKTRAARQILQELKERSKREYVPPVNFAIIHEGLGEKDQALAWLERAYENRDDNLPYLNVTPMFDSLRGEPRFQELVRRVGLPL